jgi:rubredoxin
MDKEHVCVVCGHVHDEAEEGFWAELPDDFTCPECGCGKEEYEELAV